ncbi:MAG: leucine-rich repeat protein [Clostridia bacterium]|nr:leucine-rich repeat protein [Clostridia bacterium]
MKQRFFSILLIIIILLSLITLPVSADTVVDSGKLRGTYLTWTLYDNGELVISGAGEMKTMYDSHFPWYSNNSSIKKVTINYGVTSIGKYAFHCCSNLMSITIPDSVTSIGCFAFAGCDSLESITIPDSVTSIEERAFSYCSSLTSITIPDSVTSIGDSVFSSCTSLTSITVDYLNNCYSSQNDLLFNKNGTTLICYPAGKYGAYIIPDNVKRVENGAFEGCTNLTSITIPNSVTSIGSNAFRLCDSLTSIVIPYNVKSIDSYCLFECCTSLINVTILSDIESVGNYAFSNCASLTTITIPYSVKSVGTWAFMRCTALTDIYYDGTQSQFKEISVASYGSYNTPFKNATVHYQYRIVYYDDNKQLKQINEPLTIESPMHLRDGYTFIGWSTLPYETETDYQPGDIYSDNENLYLYPIWQPDEYIVTYNANGGSGEPVAQTKLHDEPLTLTTAVPTRSNYACIGWATSSSSAVAEYQPGDIFLLNTNTTLYAVWKRTYNIYYSANGGSGAPETQIKMQDEPLLITSDTPVREGYSFLGWGTSSGTSVISYNGGDSYTNNADITLYAIWKHIDRYTVTFNANGGTGTPSSQIKEENVPLTLSSYKPLKIYAIQYNATGGSVTPASKNVNCTFNNWNTEKNGSGISYSPGDIYNPNANVTLYAQWNNPYAGTLAVPSRSGYDFVGWFTSATDGVQINDSSIVSGSMTVYAHWTEKTNIYNLGDETYSFENYGDSDSLGGHCFGMSITSSGYYNGLLDIRRIGGNVNTPLYSFSKTQTVTQPICYYQGIQGSYSNRAIVAGGSLYLNNRYNIASDWTEVVNYVKNHNYDNTGLLQIGFKKNNEGGHAINFLRYENVNGQDRLYAYDNNFPNLETYFYQDSSGHVWQTPVGTFSGSIDCIALRDCRIYFNSVGDFDATHVLYMPKNAAIVQEYTYSYIESGFSDEEYIMYEIPADQDSVIIIPNRDYADFIYMGTEYSFGEITDKTRGELKFASLKEGAANTEATFRIFETESAINDGMDFEIIDLTTSFSSYQQHLFGNVTVSVENRTGDKKTSTIILGIYDTTGKLMLCQMKDYNFNAGNNNITFNNLFLENAANERYYAKCLIWNNMKPEANVLQCDIE